MNIKFLVLISIIIFTVSCSRSENPVTAQDSGVFYLSSSTQTSESLNSRKLLGGYELLFNDESLSFTLRPLRSMQNHGEILKTDISVTILYNEIDVDDETNNIILPMRFENVDDEHKTFYDVRAFFVGVINEFQILCMNADGYANWEENDEYPDQYIMLTGQNPITSVTHF